MTDPWGFAYSLSRVHVILCVPNLNRHARYIRQPNRHRRSSNEAPFRAQEEVLRLGRLSLVLSGDRPDSSISTTAEPRLELGLEENLIEGPVCPRFFFILVERGA